MKIFISWSKVRSRHIAVALRHWLPNVIQAVEPFISTQDIFKGERGTVVIANNLEEANVGIICLTPENLSSEWILFEAGALSKAHTAHVCTYLYELEPSDIARPLGEFQHTKANKDETKSMMHAINRALGERHLDSDRLNESFETWWPKLEAQLAVVPPRPDSESLPEPRSDASKIDEILEHVRSPKVPARRDHVAAEHMGAMILPDELLEHELNHLIRRIGKEGFVHPHGVHAQVMVYGSELGLFRFSKNGIEFTEAGKARHAGLA